MADLLSRPSRSWRPARRRAPAWLVAGLVALVLLPSPALAQGQARRLNRPTSPPVEVRLPPLPSLGDEVTPHAVRVRQPAPDGPIPLPLPIPDAPQPGLIEATNGPAREITITLGQSRIFWLDRAWSRVIIANPIVAELQTLGVQGNPPRALLNLYGRAFGSTELTILDDNGRALRFQLRVTIDARGLEARIGRLLPGSEVHVSQVGPQIILDGQVPDAKTMSEVLQLVEAEVVGTQAVAFGGSPTGEAAPQEARALRDDIEPAMFQVNGAASGAPGAGGEAQPGVGTNAYGTTGTQEPQQNVLINAAPQFGGIPLPERSGGGSLPPGTIINRVHVPGPRQVLLHVKIAELNRSALREIGVNWLDTRNEAILGSTIGSIGNIYGQAGRLPLPGSVLTQSPLNQISSFAPGQFTQGQARAPGVIQPIVSSFEALAGAANTSSSQLFGIFNAGEFSLFLDALRRNSLAKILAEPNLMTLDGQPARFLSGGKYPYAVPQASNFGGPVITYQFAPFGAILQFLPTILGNEVIRLDVEPVFSRLNFANATTNPQTGQAIPSIEERRARTVVELREGQTLAIAGLLQTETDATTARVPGLGDLPIFGMLFSRNTIQTIETELVVLVTPELVAPMEKCDVPPAPGDLVLEPHDAEFYFLGRIEGKTGIPHRATVHEHDPLNVMKHFRSEGHWVVGPHGHSD